MASSCFACSTTMFCAIAFASGLQHHHEAPTTSHTNAAPAPTLAATWARAQCMLSPVTTATPPSCVLGAAWMWCAAGLGTGVGHASSASVGIGVGGAGVGAGVGGGVGGVVVATVSSCMTTPGAGVGDGVGGGV